MPAPTIRSVAARAGVSIGTVSNVLNHPAVVRPELRERVRTAITELGYLPDRRARELSSGRSRVIGLMVVDLHDPLIAGVIDGISRVAAPQDHVVALAPPSDDPEVQHRFLRTVESARYAGVVLSPGRGLDALEESIGRLQERDIAVVRLGARPDLPGMGAVRVDEPALGAAAAEHLLELGHRDLALITADAPIRRSAERAAGVRAAIARTPGVRLHVVDAAALTADAGADALARIRAEAPSTTAVLAVHDLLAYGALRAAASAGLAVPAELSVMGMEDWPASAHVSPPLTTMASPSIAMGEIAARLIIGPGTDGASDVVVTARLTRRGSTAAP